MRSLPDTGSEKVGSFEPTSLEGLSVGRVETGCFVVVVVVGCVVVTLGVVCLFLLVATTAEIMRIIESKMEIAAI